MDEEARRRMYSNPLRVLDTKNPAMQAMVNGAPRLLDFLGEGSLAHFDGLKAILDANGVPWTVNPRLVRGLDYYNLTVFEFITDMLGAQGTICAGGRYDYLIEQVGGKSAPAVGWALGWSACWSSSRSWAPTSPRPRCMPTPSFPTCRPCPWPCAPCSNCARPACACRCMRPAPKAWAA